MKKRLIAAVMVLMLLCVVLLWHCQQPRRHYQQPRPLHSVTISDSGEFGFPTFSQDGKTLALVTDKGVALWDVATWQQIKFLPEDAAWVYWMADGKTLLILGSHDVGFRTPKYHSEGDITHWNTATGHIVQVSNLMGVSPWSFGPLSPDFRRIVVQSITHTGLPPTRKNIASGKFLKSSFQVLDTAYGVKLATLPVKHLGQLQFSHEGRLLIGVEYGRSSTLRLHLWDTRTWQELPVLVGRTPDISCACFSPDGKILATGAKQQITLWNTTTWQPIRTLPAHFQYLFGLQFSPDGTRIVSSGSFEIQKPQEGIDHYWSLWNSASGQNIRNVHQSMFGGFLHKSKIFTTRENVTQTILLDEADGKTIWSSKSLAIDTDKNANIWTKVDVSPDGKCLATATSITYDSLPNSISKRNTVILQLWKL